MFDIAFFSRVIPLDIKDEVQAKRKGTMSESGESLQWKIISGLDTNLEKPVRLFNYLPVQSYPSSYSEAYVQKKLFSHCAGANDICLPFLNVKYIKRIFMGCSLYREIKKWARTESGGKKVIISYSLIPEFTKAISIAKRINPKIKSCAIVADLPEYTVLTSSLGWNTRMYLKWMKKRTNAQLRSIDSFALLTNQMAEKLVTDQSYIVMEGIASDFPAKISNEKKKKKTIVYAGTLNERFGVMRLVDAFLQIKDPDFELVICGIGDSQERIINRSKEDSRIIFKGQLKREQVLEELAKATVIVNPRPEGEEFTKYSFPSKNMEALSSGIPFVGYKLAGISDEYDAYINYPTDSSIESLAQLLFDVCTDIDGDYKSKALLAKKWVTENKNSIIQTARIVKLLSEER